MNDKTLKVTGLHTQIEGKTVLRGVDLTVEPGRVHVLMGPNGSGKSTLSYALMGHPAYRTSGKAMLDGTELLEIPVWERAKAGLFLGFQSPIAVPGVTVVQIVRTAYGELYGTKETAARPAGNPALSRRFSVPGMTIGQFMTTVRAEAEVLGLDRAFLERGINDGFSGGERKKTEILQALVLKPKYAIFDEIDTGLDVDALKLVANGIVRLKTQGTGVLLITHYQRILKYVVPDTVSVLAGGRIVAHGGPELSRHIEDAGYREYQTA